MKQLIIEIDDDDFRVLKENAYCLCLAKRVKDCGFNVIWQAYHEFASNNTIKWEAEYEIFASFTRKDREVVFANVSPKAISPGEQILLKTEGCFGEISSLQDKNCIGMLNQYIPVYPGLCQKCTDIRGNTQFSPFFLCDDKCIPGTFLTEPTENIVVWFEQGAESGMISSYIGKRMKNISASNPISLELTDRDTIKIMFKGYQWHIE